MDWKRDWKTLLQLPGIGYVVRGKEFFMSDQPSERDQLIARAQEVGVAAPWFKTNEDLKEAIAVAEQDNALTTRTDEAEGSRTGKIDVDDPVAGTIDDPNVQDPYAHLRKREETKEDGDA